MQRKTGKNSPLVTVSVSILHIYHVNTAANNAGHNQAARAVTDVRACDILIKATIGVRHIMTNLPYLRAQRASFANLMFNRKSAWL